MDDLQGLLTLSLCEINTGTVLKSLRNHLAWTAFFADLTLGLIIATRCKNHHKIINWVGSLINKVNILLIYLLLS